MKVTNVILSGGVGSRLWPLSRKSRPKQYLPLFNGKSLFELTVERNKQVCDHVLVVGGKDNFELSRQLLKGSSYVEIIEAAPRNTAAAIAFAAFSQDSEDILLITPSDHLIENAQAYESSILDAVSLAKEGFLVTFGLVPTKPETGFGYIEYTGNKVLSFREKPNKETAEEFIKSGNFLWNSGMFCFSAGVYLQQLQKYEPSVYDTSLEAFKNSKDGFLPEEESMKIPSISVDYAVMERSDKIRVIASSFKWSDMGSFEALYEYISEDDPRKSGTNLTLGTDKKVEFLGVKDIILVETKDAILVLDKNYAQDVKKIYERLEKEEPTLLA